MIHPKFQFDLEGKVYEGCGPNGDDFVIPDMFESCSVCESISVADLLKAFQIEGTIYKVMPWNQHPVGIELQVPCDPFVFPFLLKENGVARIEWAESRHAESTFRVLHLKGASVKELNIWRELVTPHIGIVFEHRNFQVAWRSHHRGIAVEGRIGTTIPAFLHPRSMTQ